jgi:hypothetical protein
MAGGSLGLVLEKCDWEMTLDNRTNRAVAEFPRLQLGATQHSGRQAATEGGREEPDLQHKLF